MDNDDEPIRCERCDGTGDMEMWEPADYGPGMWMWKDECDQCGGTGVARD